MKNIKAQSYAIILIIAAVFSAFAFLIPIEREGVFWIGFIFGLASILIQIPVFGFSFPQESQLKSKVLGYPVFRIGIIYLVVQMILSGILFFAGDSGDFPVWLALLLCIIVLAGALVFGITANMAREAISNMETVSKADTRMMKSLALRAEALASNTNDPMLMKELKKLAEDISFSDPVSDPVIAEQEHALVSVFGQLEAAVNSQNPGAIDLCRNVGIALSNRNAACKANKR
ncbi:MAG: hypothetical protein IJK31_09595 [Ruminococcus sp.]|nr:hypothetical protein [Ruminococcus sp.]HRR75601.1 hypothetical protein [Ruminococcus sp.]